MDREGKHCVTRRKEKTTKSAPRARLRRAIGEKRVLLLSPSRMNRYRYRSLRLAKALRFTASNKECSSRRETRSAHPFSAKRDRFLDQSVCECVCGSNTDKLSRLFCRCLLEPAKGLEPPTY